MTDAVTFMAALAAEFDRLGLPFHLGGSWASTLHGRPRQTLDIDFVLELDSPRVNALASAIAARGWYASTTAMREAIENESSFNVLSPDTGLKADCFVRGSSEFDRSEFARPSLHVIESEPRVEIPVKSAEDTVLRKLLWFRDTGGTSERQWGDVLGVLAVRGASLDRGYLSMWAARLDLVELLERAEREVSGR